jgi:hypothetical protein
MNVGKPVENADSHLHPLVHMSGAPKSVHGQTPGPGGD